LNTGAWTPDQWRLALDVVNGGALLALWIYAVLTRRSKVNEDRLGTIDKDIRRIDIDLVGMKQKLDDAPNHDDLEKLHTRISEVKNSVSQIGREVSGTAATVNAIDRNMVLLNRKLLGDGDD